ncbi:hypothetical protein QAD02_013144 [Eretmocerus hayati]|uniref:Uncharacterized protein n=1 Tax=Eretmocerus hayati TaxID=131215 RepID=A0ACC2P1V4_9HYME|nr:hypothetical protein QAD02_013144 [Eretmocerus hayati]
MFSAESVDGRTFLILDKVDMRAMSILMGPAKELLEIIERFDTVEGTLKSTDQGKKILETLRKENLSTAARKELIRLIIAELVQVLAEALIKEFPFLKDPRRPLGYERFYDPKTKKGFFHWRLQTLQQKAPPELGQYNEKSKPILKDAVLESEVGILLSEDELNGVCNWKITVFVIHIHNNW